MPEMPEYLAVMLVAAPLSPEQATRTMEVLSRAVSGLAMEGIGVTVRACASNDQGELL